MALTGRAPASGLQRFHGERNMNPISRVCPNCGRQVPPDAPAELCPSCLVRGGLSDVGSMVESTSAATSTLHLVIPEDAPLPEGAPTQLGNYELLEMIARGGMGVVYKARHTGLDRVVALKMIRSGILATPKDVERFQREARSAAKLHHPNIVTIHDIGEQAGQHYYTMDYVPGENLAERARTRPFSPRQAAEITAAVAGAIHCAHQQGVLHRDIKPANVILTPNQQPRVLDFGLALILTDDSDLTQTGTPVGSPAYMPPEQAAGQTRRIDARSDVYSLGAMLYELLTGRPPFQAATTLETLQLVIANEAVSPRRLNPALPRDLETICLKCLEKAPNRRYQTARELADELDRFLKDEPIRARPISSPARLMRWCRRKPALAASLGAGIVLMLVIAIGSPIAVVRINAARQQEAALRARAESAERETEQQLYSALLEQARSTVRSGELGHRVHTLDAVRRAAAISNTVELRHEAFAALGLLDLRFQRELPTGPDCTMAALDAKFERLAVGRGSNAVEIRAASDQALLATLSPSTGEEFATDGKWSADGRFLAVRRSSRRVQTSTSLAHVEIWNVESGRRVLSLPPMAWGAFSFHPTLPRVLSADLGDTVSAWDLENGGKLVAFSVTGAVQHLEFSPDGRSFVVQHRIEKPWFTSLYDAVGGILRTSLITGWIDGLAWHPQGTWIALAGRGGDVMLHSEKDGTTSLLGRHRNGARTALFSPDGQYLFTGGGEQEIICWDLRLRQPLLTIRPRSTQMQFRADGWQCAIVTKGAVQLYLLERPVACRELAADLGGSLWHGAISSNGRWLAVGGLTRLGLWDLARDAPPALPFDDENPTSFFSPDGTELFAKKTT